ncbi:MAG: DUF1801 domain-containing protein [Bacteroidetes bacterium]|nr:DUF1801 domain-containing protein [Bacteroidota bacterium]
MRIFQSYFDNVSEDKSEDLKKMAAVIADSLPTGFAPEMQYNMPSWVVPLALYPAGYHCKPDTPLPFISIASQKTHLAVYHMGLYASPALMEWLQKECGKSEIKMPDMGKSCLRFKYKSDIPFNLIGELCKKVSPEAWIQLYESAFRK